MKLAVLTFIIAVGYFPGLPSNAAVGRWIAVGIGAAILSYSIRLRPTPELWAWGALLLWILLGFAWCVSAWDHAGGLLQWSVLAVVFFVGMSTISLERVWIALAAGVSVSAAFALLQRFGIETVWTVSTDSAVGLFLSKNMAGEIAVLALIGALSLRGRYFWLSIGPTVAIYLLASRATWVALLVAGVAYLWIGVTRQERVDRALALVFFLILALVTAHAYGRLPADVFRLEDRLSIWSVIVPQISPWGDGLGSVAVALTSVEFAHNEFIHYAFELGIGSLLIWGIAARGLFAPDGTTEKVALAALATFCLVWFPLHAPATAFMGALMAGHLCGRRYLARDLELTRGADRGGGTSISEPIGVGSLSTADLGRVYLSAGSEYPMVAGAIRPSL